MKPTTVDEYFNNLSEPARAKVSELRAILKEVAPEAKEELKWGYPAFVSNMILFAYGGHKAHLNFFPTGPALVPFADELAAFKTKQDSVQFPYDKPLPVDLIRRIAEHRKYEAEVKGAKWRY